MEESSGMMRGLQQRVGDLVERVVQVKEDIRNEDGESEVPILEFIQRSIVQQVEEDIKIDPSSEEVDRILENQSKKDLIQNLSQDCGGDQGEEQAEILS